MLMSFFFNELCNWLMENREGTKSSIWFFSMNQCGFISYLTFTTAHFQQSSSEGSYDVAVTCLIYTYWQIFLLVEVGWLCYLLSNFSSTVSQAKPGKSPIDISVQFALWYQPGVTLIWIIWKTWTDYTMELLLLIGSNATGRSQSQTDTLKQIKCFNNHHSYFSMCSSFPASSSC